jgi:transposase-like protein
MGNQDARSLPAEAQEDLRRRVVEAVQKGLSQTEVARVFGVARGTVSRWMGMVEREGRRALKAQRRGRPERFTPYNELPPRPALKQHTQIQVDPTIFKKYLGRYGNPPNLILVVRQEGDHLSVQENEEPKEELFPEGEKDLAWQSVFVIF